MNKFEEVMNNAVERWRANAGKGTAYIFPPFDERAYLITILHKMYNKDPTTNVVICLDKYEERAKLIKYFTTASDDEHNVLLSKAINSKHLKIWTIDLVAKLKELPELIVLFKVSEYYKNIRHLVEATKFRLVILNKIITNIDNLYTIAPVIEEFSVNNQIVARTSTPVEEIRYGVELGENAAFYKDYSDYITTSMNIFTSIDSLTKARNGDYTQNLSSIQYCYQIAYDNGWSEDLDMTLSFNKSLDDMYNPNTLKDRAFNTFEYIRKRAALAINNYEKVKIIADILNSNDNKDKRFLIISKDGNFSNDITNYINNNTTHKCGNIHNKVFTIPAVDMYDNPIYVKTGKNKGERKTMGAAAQKTLNITKYNAGLLDVLSASNSIEKDVQFSVDVVIITSPMCFTLQEFLYRLSNVIFNTDNIKCYMLYTFSTIEEKALKSQNRANNYTIIEANVNNSEIDTENDYFFSENFGD